ncbi:hypothetical protein [Leifsonia shinshuensis]|uniref:hypothetical protein n=1 Tax=Leifsonia shinshuensis TaxID=150026 RepID=UPI00215643D7|nr:hypothetical protein [Leifsonia shinshuensis]
MDPEAGADEAGAAAGDVPPPAASPATLAALPATVTGTATLTRAWSPPATDDPSPLVVTDGVGAAAAGAADVPDVDESPRTAIPLPVTVIGAVTPIAAWSPEATPPVPLVVGDSAAFAAAVPASQSPPTQRVNHNPLETYLFIVQPFE